MLERLGDWLIVASIVIYLFATIAYLFGKRQWDAVYWAACAVINFAVLMIKNHK